MNPIENTPKNSRTNTGVFGMLHAFLRDGGTGARSGAKRSIAQLIAVIVMTVGLMGFSGTSALAANPPEAPETTKASAVTSTSAVLEGVLNPNAAAAAKAGWYFAYSTELIGGCAVGSMTSLEPEETVKAKAEKFKVEGLQPNREYTFCLVATNEGGAQATPSATEVRFTTKPAPPTIVSEHVSERTPTSATLSAQVNPDNQEITEYAFEYATKEALIGTPSAITISGALGTPPPPLPAEFNEGGVGVSVPTGEHLTSGATYYYRVLAKNEKGEESKGRIKHFTFATIAPDKPIDEKVKAGSITATTATVEGELNPLKAGEEGSYEFLYKVSALSAPAPTACEEESRAPEPAGEALGLKEEVVSAKLEKLHQLQPDAKYTFCLRVHNEADEEATGAPVAFDTKAAPPAIKSGSETTSGVTPFEATLEAEVNPNNQASTYSFEYSTTEAAGKLTGTITTVRGASPLSGFGDQRVSVATRRVLAAGTNYYYHVVAENAAHEKSEGEVEEFTTPAAVAPEILSESFSNVKATEVTLEGEVNPNYDQPECHFEYGDALVSEHEAACTPELLSGTGGRSVGPMKPENGDMVPVPITGLTSHTTYKYRIVLNYGAGKEITGTEATFKTAIALETPVEEKAEPVGSSSATLKGALNPAGERKEEPGSYEFVYRQSATECLYVLTPAQEKSLEEQKTTTSEAKLKEDRAKLAENKATPLTTATGSEKEAAEAEVKELLPGTQYTFCLRATNEAGEEALGARETFTTLAIAPAITEEFATNTSSNSATLHAKLNPGGTATTYHFEYDTRPYGEGEGPHGTTIPAPDGSAGSGPSVVEVSAEIQGLTAGTTYHYRVLATNEAQGKANTVAGPDETFTTQTTGGEFTLPDGRQYEMVTPPEKQGALFFRPENRGRQVIQASAAGDAIVDLASQPTEAQPQGYANRVSVLSTRGSGGWSSQVIAAPHEQAAASPFSFGQEYRAFSEDLSHAAVQPAGLFTPLSPEASEYTTYLRTNFPSEAPGENRSSIEPSERCDGSYLTSSSCFQPLVSAANDTASPFRPFGEAEPATGYCPEASCGPRFVDATPDLSHIILHSPVQLTSTPGAGYYEWSGGRLQLLPGEPLPGDRIPIGSTEIAGRYAISSDGGRVILENGGFLNLFEVAKNESVPLDAAEPGCGTCESGGNGGGLFEAASSDDSRTFFLDDNRLTRESSVNGPDLYEYDLEAKGKRLTDLTPEPETGGESPNVVDVLGVSGDGSYVYFAAGGRLAPGAVHGECAEVHEPETEGCNVYVRHDGVTKLVAPGWLGASAYPYPFELARVAPDGRWLAFVSSRSLTGYDNRDANSGQPDAEVYLYHAPENFAGEPGTLACASCNPTGAAPVGTPVPSQLLGSTAATVPGWTYFGSSGDHELPVYQPRYVSDNGRLFFDSYDALVPQDVNGQQDVYQYEPENIPSGEHACGPGSVSGSEVFKPAHAFAVDVEGIKDEGAEGAGCVSLISSGTSSQESSFLDASAGGGEGEHGEAGTEGGADVFFLTTSKLAPQDFDTAADVYDAHECTSASPCIPPPAQAAPACTTEASCKASPTPQPSIYGAPSSATFSGPGNLAPPPPAVVKKVTTKTVKCRKGYTKNKKGKCLKKKKKKTRAKKASKSHKGAKS
jgi:hypothetical protein